MKYRAWLAAIPGIALSVAGSFAPQVALAAIIQIDVAGTIHDSFDETGSLFGLGAGNDTAVGQSILVTFRIDTAAAPTDSTGGVTPGYASYTNTCDSVATDWLGSSAASVGGTVLPGALTTGNFYDCDKAVVANDYASPELVDAMLLSTEAWEYSFDLAGFRDRRALDSINLVGDTAWLSSVSLEQSFTVTSPGNIQGYVGRINYSYDRLPDGSFTNTQYWNGFARYRAVSATAYVVAVPVPEPGIAGLFSLGLLGIMAALLARRAAVRRT